MTAVALLFSLFRVKPSAFCVTDELDAALEDANIKRYLQMLKSFLDETQFIVITHNRQTIATADALYGVTMEKQGISKIVSVKFRSQDKNSPAASLACRVGGVRGWGAAIMRIVFQSIRLFPDIRTCRLPHSI